MAKSAGKTPWFDAASDSPLLFETCVSCCGSGARSRRPFCKAAAQAERPAENVGTKICHDRLTADGRLGRTTDDGERR